jgi:hypothetical protein
MNARMPRQRDPPHLRAGGARWERPQEPSNPQRSGASPRRMPVTAPTRLRIAREAASLSRRAAARNGTETGQANSKT